MDTSVENFHANCLMKWNCYNCPICYYIQNPDQINNSACMKCDGANALWFCLHCGHVGCDRLEERHALYHYNETKHQYVMGLESFNVWDYKLDKFVHNFDDDKDKNFDNFHTYSNNFTESSCSCPVCRHVTTPKLFKEPMCMKCKDDTLGKLWICLYCSYIGCSRNRSGHALEHYRNTKHPFSMQLNNFSIWDYTKHAYLHRHLHENMDKSKIVDDVKDVQKMELKKRMDRLEKEWSEFRKLNETNEQMMTIEQRLVALTQEKKVLEAKIQEHDTKLNVLITQFIGNREFSLETKVVEASQMNVMSQNFEINKNSKEISYKSNGIDGNFKNFGFMYSIVLILFLYRFIMLFM